jgi:hypothetical protein
MKNVLAFYITSWYIIFTPDMGEKTKVRGKLVDKKISNIRRRTT